jgi:hypothetical protein
MIPDTLEGRGECVSDHELIPESSLFHQNYVANGKPKNSTKEKYLKIN